MLSALHYQFPFCSGECLLGLVSLFSLAPCLERPINVLILMPAIFYFVSVCVQWPEGETFTITLQKLLIDQSLSRLHYNNIHTSMIFNYVVGLWFISYIARYVCMSPIDLMASVKDLF